MSDEINDNSLPEPSEYAKEFLKPKAGNPKWQKGVSANPTGRPKGIRDARHIYKDMFQSGAEELIRRVIEMANEGDVHAMRLCLERICPPVKISPDDFICNELRLEMGNISTPKDLDSFAERLMSYTQMGKLPLPHAESLMKICKDKLDMTLKVKMLELTEDRVAEIEKKLGIEAQT